MHLSIFFQQKENQSDTCGFRQWDQFFLQTSTAVASCKYEEYVGIVEYTKGKPLLESQVDFQVYACKIRTTLI